ncbi:MAG: hypothetical protein KDH09_17285, partial [Chrysiogenetes bacterium]|nr:hypothetical protein [Chrysiogenetes bacterium]
MAKKRTNKSGKSAARSGVKPAEEKIPATGKLALAIFALVFAVFSLSNLDGVFVFDDLATLQDNAGVTKFRPWDLGTWWAAAFDGPAKLRPLSNFSFAAQWYFFEDHVAAYHVLSNALHAGFA